MPGRRNILAALGSAAALAALPGRARVWEQRDDIGFLRGPYNEAFYYNHNEAYRIGAAMHFFHSKQHDLLLQTPLDEHARYDRLLNDQSLGYLRDLPRTEPVMLYYSEFTDRAMHTIFRAIDWTHMHHEQTYDIMAARSAERLAPVAAAVNSGTTLPGWHLRVLDGNHLPASEKRLAPLRGHRGTAATIILNRVCS